MKYSELSCRFVSHKRGSLSSTDTHYKAIMQDLLAALATREWRNRESSCLGIADLLSGRRYSDVSPFLEQIFTLMFRVLDDMKVC